MDEEIKKNILTKMKRVQCRKFFYTIWIDKLIEPMNWTEIWKDFNDIIRHIKVQKEKGKKTGKLHWQGVIHMYDPCGFKKVCKILGIVINNHRIERQITTGDLDYVHKDETSQGERFYFGSPSVQGFRTDQRHMMKMIREGATNLELMEQYPSNMMRYDRFFKNYRDEILLEKSLEFIPQKVILITGPTNQHKTRLALYDEQGKRKRNVYKINCENNLKWFDGYLGEDTILLDEFDNNVNLSKLLDITKGHQRRVERKGSHTYLTSSTTYITTNLKPEEMYPGIKPAQREALMKRFTTIISLWPSQPTADPPLQDEEIFHKKPNMLQSVQGNNRNSWPRKKKDKG